MSEAVVLDTNVVSFLRRGDPRAARFEPILVGRVPAVSFATGAELRYGALWGGWGERRRQALELMLRRYLFRPAGPEVSATWARIRCTMDAAGHGMSGLDRRIAATALAHDCPLFTDNDRHLERVPGLVLNPGFAAPGPGPGT